VAPSGKKKKGRIVICGGITLEKRKALSADEEQPIQSSRGENPCASRMRGVITEVVKRFVVNDLHELGLGEVAGSRGKTSTQMGRLEATGPNEKHLYYPRWLMPMCMPVGIKEEGGTIVLRGRKRHLSRKTRRCTEIRKT